MKVLAEIEGKVYGALSAATPADFTSPFPGRPFLCLLWDHEGRASDADRSTLARALLEAGCRYAVCGGRDCEAWHDAFDAEFIRKNGPGEPDDSTHVITTWHDGESPAEVAFFFVDCTGPGGPSFKDHLVLHIGEGEAKTALESAVARYALDKTAD